MRLDQERLAALESEFAKVEDGLEMPQFIFLLQCAIPHPHDEKYELINGLIKLFYDIDINGDQKIEWSEFTQYIIDAVLAQQTELNDLEGENIRNNLIIIGNNDDDEDELLINDLEKLGEIDKKKIERAYAQVTKEYRLDDSFGQNLTFATPLQRISYSPKFRKFYILETKSNRIKLANLNLCVTGYKELPYSGTDKGSKLLHDKTEYYIFDIAVSNTHEVVLAQE